MVGRDHVAREGETVAVTHLAQRLDKDISDACRAQQRQAAITGEGNEVQMAVPVVTMSFLAMKRGKRKPPRPRPLKTARVGHTEKQHRNPGHPALTYWSGIIQAWSAVKKKNRGRVCHPPMSLNEWMNRSFKNWLLVGASIFLAIGTLLAICFHASSRTSWNVVISQTFYFVSIQIAAFAGMYFARKYGRAHRDLRPGFLLLGAYFLAMGLLAIRYSVGWGLMSRTEQHSNFIGYTIFMVSVTLILIILPLPWKL